MYHSILVATDGSETADKAVSAASRLAQAFEAKLTIVTVSEPPPTFATAELGWTISGTVYDELRKANADRCRAILDRAVSLAGRPVETVHVEDSFPDEGILDAARKVDADLIVMGSHGYRGLERLVLGSQASKVLNHADRSVLIVKSAAA